MNINNLKFHYIVHVQKLNQIKAHIISSVGLRGALGGSNRVATYNQEISIEHFYSK